MLKIDYKELEIKPHNIIVAVTSEPGYEMGREILLEFDYGDYVVLEGSHCSCYDFDDTEWEAIKYTHEELRKIAEADYNRNSEFWKLVREQL